MRTEDVETPAIIINSQVVEHNIEKAIILASHAGKKLRPHIKTHKMTELALLQTEKYSSGICTAKISEAEVMADAGISDILIANEIVGDDKLMRLAALARRVRLSVLTDSFDTLDPLIRASERDRVRIGVLVELECGDERCGTDIETAIKLASAIQKSSYLKFLGIELFGGWVFHTTDSETLENNVLQLRQIIQNALSAFRKAGIEADVVSVGGSPAFRQLCQVPEITELRPGVYIFNDGAAVSRGGADWAECALAVVTTVISVNREKRYAVLDGGAKTFSYCRPGIVFGNRILHGVCRTDHNAVLSGLSEEHGILDLSNSILDVKVGDRVEIIPSHACPVVNLTDTVYFMDQDGLLTEKRVDARGMTR